MAGSEVLLDRKYFYFNIQQGREMVLNHRDYSNSIIAAYNHPFSVALFTGGAADIFRSYVKGENFELIKNSLLHKFPEYKEDIASDIDDVSSFILMNIDSDSLEGQQKQRTFVSLSVIKEYARKNRLLTNATIELTTRCNLRCEHCFHSNYTLQGLLLNQIEQLLVSLREAGVLFLCLTGGELFLRDDALAIIEKASSLGFIIEIKTNGTVLNKDIISILSSKCISDIQVSVYGLDDDYSEFTKSNYKFSTVSRNIQDIVSAKIPCSISYQVTPRNIGTLEQAYSVLAGFTDNVYFSYYVTPNLGVPTSNLGARLSYEDIRDKVLPRLRSWGIDTAPTRYRTKDCGYVCWAGYEQIFISADGTVYPCADLKIPLGNLSNQTFKEISSNRFDCLSKFMPKSIPVCSNCTYHDFCDSCIGIANIENGSFFVPSKHKCAITKLQVEKGGDTDE